MIEVIFLICLGLFVIALASIQDLKKREVDNWLSFSLIVFALGFRFFWSLFEGTGFGFFYQGLIGLGIFFVIGNLFYYSRVFAGGDAKLMIALGTIIPLDLIFKTNLKFFVLFLFLFLFVGSIYGLIWSFFLVIKHGRNFIIEFKTQFRKYGLFMNLIFVLALIVMILGLIYDTLLFYLGVLLFLIPYLFLYAKAVDEACMIKSISPEKLVEGDWLYRDVRIKKDYTVHASWDGVSLRDIGILKNRNKSVLVREGIPFIPVFFFTFLIFLWFYLGYSPWNTYLF